ncbi:hypothetical protein EYF80_029458 [Liparis tanakae]|uniref:Uncharacterized protein n=1 Tax=Liparis tanakae TaxID=230148 RepID=A0A4Z2H5E0_9TELE|nr:hypothetical protein EYF80_029458 [Liparis tanakae]
MSSAIILSAALVNLFWSTNADAGAAPELELGLELELRGKEGLMDAKLTMVLIKRFLSVT